MATKTDIRIEKTKTADGLHLYRLTESAADSVASLHAVQFSLDNGKTIPRAAYPRVVDFRFYSDGLKIRKTDQKILVFIGDKIKDSHPAECRAGFCYVNVASLLSVDTSNVKLAKSASKFSDTMSVIYYGAPAHAASMADGFKINTCGFATDSCVALCLNTAGNGRYDSVQLSRIARTRYSRWDRSGFWAKFDNELQAFARKAAKLGKRLACRPNGTTDERSPQLRELMLRYPEVRFYDYSAVPSALTVAENYSNYDVTVSRKETEENQAHCETAFAAGYNMAIVVTPEAKELLLRRYPDLCVDFDTHDLRLPEIDGRGKLGLLSPKGKARGKSGDMIHSFVDVLRLFIEPASTISA